MTDKKNRYSGEDSQAWTVKGANGRPILFAEKGGKPRAVSTNKFTEANGVVSTCVRLASLLRRCVRECHSGVQPHSAEETAPLLGRGSGLWWVVDTPFLRARIPNPLLG